jgi:hypothetical protein
MGVGIGLRPQCTTSGKLSRVRVFQGSLLGQHVDRRDSWTSEVGSRFANSIHSFFLLEWPTSSTLPQVTQKPNAKNNVRLPCALQVFGYLDIWKGLYADWLCPSLKK